MTVDQITMQSIRGWLETNESESEEILNQNTSYIFFRWLDKGNARLGPHGALGIALVAGRSIAVDRKYIPLGMPLWIDVAFRGFDNDYPDKELKRLMVAQDTGGAIKGPLRGDVFWGTGTMAGTIAGRMKHSGRYWLLLPRKSDEKIAND
jgi:membrane-bound lytic murein transglycosylase A